MIQQLAWRHFTKKHSLSLRPEVIEFLQVRLMNLSDEQKTSIIEYIANAYAARLNTSKIVDLESLEEIIKQLFRSHQLQTQQIVPKNYIKVIESEPKAVCFDPLAKNFLFTLDYDLVHRYHLLFERVQRLNSSQAFLSIKSLKSREMNNVWTFGMLCKADEGSIYLEDPDDQISLDISSMKIDDQILIETCFYIVSGDVSDGIVYAKVISLPPIDPRSSSLKLSGFPCPLKEVALKTEAQSVLIDVEQKCPNSFLACLSEVWLDRSNVVDAIDSIMSGFSNAEYLPSAMVFLGRFHSSPPSAYLQSVKTIEVYTSVFSKLCNVILKYPKLKAECKFIFASGPQESFSVPHVLPRHPIPEECFKDFQTHSIDYSVASDPCRIYWFAQELLFTRDDLSSKINRSMIVPVKSATPELAAKFVTSQSCLQPFSPAVQPVGNSSALSVYPIPDLLVISENCPNCQTGQLAASANYANPTSFVHTGSFITYHPASRTVEQCSVN